MQLKAQGQGLAPGIAGFKDSNNVVRNCLLFILLFIILQSWLCLVANGCSNISYLR